MKMTIISISLFILFAPLSYADDKTVNVYAWASEIPSSVIAQFEKETGIHVNITTYDNNEIMYAKMRSTKNPGYDVVMPSSYFVDRMYKQNMLVKLDKTQLPNIKNIDPTFANPTYDPHLQYSVPYLFGVTGIFINNKYQAPSDVTQWNDLWDKRFYNQLMLLDDTRENFSIALLALHFSPNDTDPQHIALAFEKLKTLMPNVKVFASDTVVSIMIDEDVTIGSAWNGDVYKAESENSHVQFVFPKEGFVIWVDNFAIPKSAPHLANAYTFINFMTRADIAKQATLFTKFGTVNAEGKKLLPNNIQQNALIYPPKNILKYGIFQTDLGENTLAIYERYWEKLKMGAN